MIQKHYNITEVADILHMSHWRVRYLIGQRRLAYSRFGGPKGQIRVSAADLEAFLERNRVAAHGERSV
jgi:Helix-turn-helix domain